MGFFKDTTELLLSSAAVLGRAAMGVTPATAQKDTQAPFFDAAVTSGGLPISGRLWYPAPYISQMYIEGGKSLP